MAVNSPNNNNDPKVLSVSAEFIYLLANNSSFDGFVQSKPPCLVLLGDFVVFEPK